MGSGASRDNFALVEYEGPPLENVPRRRESFNWVGGENDRKSPRPGERSSPRSPRRTSITPRGDTGVVRGSDDFKLDGKDISIFGKESSNVLGVGYISRVRLAKSIKTGRFCVVKQMAKLDILRKQALSQIVSEKRLLAKLSTSRNRSPFIVELWGSFQDELNVYLVYEYLAGGELFRLLRIQGAFCNTMCKFYAAELLLALDHLHRNDVLHRDVKPENILVTPSG